MKCATPFRVASVVWLAFVSAVVAGKACAPTPPETLPPQDGPQIVLFTTDDGRLPGDDIQAQDPPIQEDYENELIPAALLEKAHLIDDCTITWYCNDTCGKKPGDPAYGITASGMETVAELTCAVDKRVIPLYSDVFVEFPDGTVHQYWATDTGVKGNHVDIFEPDYDTCIQNGLQHLKVWWISE